MSGWFEVGVYGPKYAVNIGTLWRSAYQLGASGIYTIGARYKRQPGDTVNAARNVPMRQHNTFDSFKEMLPVGARVVAVEMGGEPLATFTHPREAVYLLGAEDSGIPRAILDKCHLHVAIESLRIESYNMAVAGSIVMYHRLKGAPQTGEANARLIAAAPALLEACKEAAALWDGTDAPIGVKLRAAIEQVEKGAL